MPARVPRVGILTPAESDQTPIFEAFRRGLKDLGYTEGRNIAVEFRSARGNSALLPRTRRRTGCAAGGYHRDGRRRRRARRAGGDPENTNCHGDQRHRPGGPGIGPEPAPARGQSHRFYADARAARGKAGRLGANAGARSQGGAIDRLVARREPPAGRTSRVDSAAVAGGGPNRATAIIVARLVFTISGASRAFTALRLIDLVTATHSHMNELATLEFGLQQLARLEDELAPDGAVKQRSHGGLLAETIVAPSSGHESKLQSGRDSTST